jgi:hypothetical protein
MGDPSREYRGNINGPTRYDADADVNAPGRGTLAGTAPASPEGVALQQLRVAQGAVSQILSTWIPMLAQANAQGKYVGDLAMLNARSAMNRLEVGIAQATALNTVALSDGVHFQVLVLTGQRDALKSTMDPLLATQMKLGAAPGAKTGTPAPTTSGTGTGGGATSAPHTAPQKVDVKIDPSKSSAMPSVIRGPSYAPSWETISKAAAGDASALAALDVTWIDGLHRLIIEGIDVGFSRQEQETAFLNEVRYSKELQKMDADHKKESSAAYAEAKERRKQANEDLKDASIKADAAYVEAKEKLDEGHKVERDKAVAELRAKFDAKKHKVHHQEDVATPPKEGVTREEGRLLARANFVSWGAQVLGSVEGVKKHFTAIREVSTIKEKKWPLLLHSSAASRLEQAWDWFEKAYPGNTMYQTTVGFGLRGVHHEGHPLSYLGHALGLSIDFQAYSNPSFLKDPVGMFMLRRFGGHEEGGKYVYGHSRMEIAGSNYKTMIEMGKTMSQGKDIDAEGQKLLDAAGAAYDKMTTTSDNLKTSIGGTVEQLQEGKKAWVQIQGALKAELGTANAAIATAKQKAAAKVAKEMPKDTSKEDRQKAIDADEGVVAANNARAEVEKKIAAQQAIVDEAMARAFAPWLKGLESDMVAQHKLADPEKAITADAKQASQLLAQVKNAKALPQLQYILKTPLGKQVFDAALLEEKDPKELKEKMLARATAFDAAKNAAGEIAAREEIVRRVKDPTSVFGKVAGNGKGGWSAQREVDSPPIIQLLEIGFAQHDTLAPDDNKGAKKQVFNREFVQAMMRFGWNCGADWGTIDTMHFDFLEGLSALAGGTLNFYGTNFGPKPE